MPALAGSKGRPRDNETTRSGRKHIQRLLAPALSVLEGIIHGEPTCAHDRTERRKTAQYVVDQNLGRAAFQVYGQIDIHKQELVFKAFLAGGADQLPEAERLQLAQVIDSVPGEVAEHTLCDTEAEGAEPEQEASGGLPPGVRWYGEPTSDQGATREEPQGTEPCDASY